MLQMAIGEKDGKTYLDQTRYGFGRTRTTDMATVYPIEMRSIDSVVEEIKPESIDLIKIDIEGDELKCLKGSLKTLKKYNPDLIIAAYHLEDENVMIESFLQRHGYKVYRYFVPPFLSFSSELYLYAKAKC